MKDAADFPMNAAAWLTGTRHLTREERGDYIDLLALQWQNDGLPADLDAVARSIGYKNAKKLSQNLIEKFPLMEDGKRRNIRLEIERGKQRSRMDKARERIEKMNFAREKQASCRASTRASTREENTPLQESHTEHLQGPPHTLTHTLTQESNSLRDVGADAPKRPPRSPRSKTAPIPAESEEACQRFAVEIGAHWRDGKAFWDTMQDAGWTKNGGKIPVLDWKATLRKWDSMGYLPSKKVPWTIDREEPPPWVKTEAEEPQIFPDEDGETNRSALAKAREEFRLAQEGSDELEVVV